MKKIYTILLLFILSFTCYAQSQYATIKNRVLLSGVVNQDTIIIENINNKVLINGELHLLKVTYNNIDSRLVKPAVTSDNRERADIVFEFYNEYTWLDEQLKTIEPFTQFTDEILVMVHNEELNIPVTIGISRIRGIQGFLVMIEISGQFSAKSLAEDFPELVFREDLNFQIFLTVQVTN